MSKQSVTYEDLKKDSKFLNAAYSTLRGLGENVSKEPEEIVDTFLTKRRWFNANLLATTLQANDILKFKPHMIKDYQYAVDKINAVPNFGEGSAPTWEATTDYIKAAVSDPANIASGLAAFFTLGGGGVAGFAAKETAKIGLIKSIKNKLKTLAGKEALKVYALEGSVAGASEGTRENISQDIEIAAGKRTKKDFGDIALSTAIGTAAAPIVGITGNIAFDVAKEGVLKPVGRGMSKGFTKVATKIHPDLAEIIPTIGRVANTIKNNIIPTAQLDESIVRVAELTTGQTRPLEEAIEKLTSKMDVEIKNNFSTKEDTDLLNNALEGDSNALSQIAQRSNDMKTYIQEWADIVRQLQDIAGAGKFINSKIKGKYKYNPNKNYVRDIYDKFISDSREPFEEFIKKNPTILGDLKKLLINDKEYGKKAGLYDAKGKFKQNIDVDKAVKDFAEVQYGPILNRRKKLGPLIKKDTKIDEVIKTIWGYNNKPAVRAFQTVEGIISSSKEMRLASSLAESLLSRGIAKRLPKGEAPSDNMVSLTTGLTRGVGGKAERGNQDSPFALSEFQKLVGLENVYIDKDVAKTVKALVKQFDGSRSVTEDDFIGSAVNIMSAIQGGLKKGKTIYNPIAHIRNAMGATQYLIASGNGMGIVDGMKFLATATPEQKKNLFDTVSRLGLKGSQVDLNQIFTRLAEIEKQGGTKANKIGRGIAIASMTLGQNLLEKIPGLKQLSKGAEKIYMGTDDLAKIASFMREKTTSQKIWDNMSDELKKQKRFEYSKTFKGGSVIPGQEQALKNFDDELINEMAVSKVMNLVPVYSRIPPIIEKLRGIPIVGNFSAFPAENLRTKYNLFKISGNEIQEGLATGNKALVNSGLRRLASQATVAGGAYAGTWVYNKLEGTDKYIEAIRNTLPEWARDGALAVSEDDKGRITYQNMSYINPDQYTLDLIMPFILDVQSGRDIDQSTMDVIGTIAKRLFEPFLGTSLAVQSGFEFADAVKSLATGEGDFLDKFLNVAKTQEPGWAKIAREIAVDAGFLDTNAYNAASLEYKLDHRLVGEKPERFENYSLFENLSRYGVNPLQPWALGVKTQEFKPREQLAYTIRALNSGQNKTYKQGSRNINQMIENSATPVDMKEVSKIYREMLSTQFESRQQMKDLFLSYQSFLEPFELNRLLLNDDIVRGSLSKEQIRYLIRNRFIPTKLSDSKNLMKKIEMTNKNRPRTEKISPYTFRNSLWQVEKEFDNRPLANDVEDKD